MLTFSLLLKCAAKWTKTGAVVETTNQQEVLWHHKGGKERLLSLPRSLLQLWPKKTMNFAKVTLGWVKISHNILMWKMCVKHMQFTVILPSCWQQEAVLQSKMMLSVARRRWRCYPALQSHPAISSVSGRQWIRLGYDLSLPRKVLKMNASSLLCATYYRRRHDEVLSSLRSLLESAASQNS